MFCVCSTALSHPHTFFCHLELGSDWEVPKQFHCQVEVEFDMPAACASKATVRSLSVGDKTDIKKWITYRSHFSYKVMFFSVSVCVSLCVLILWVCV